MNAPAAPTVPLKGHITEISARKGNTRTEILSVTNANGLVRSLDTFDKQVYSADTSAYKLVQHDDLVYNPSRVNVGSIARCDFADGGAVSPMYVVVRCDRSLDPRYLLYFLKSDVGRRVIIYRSVGAVRSQLRFRDLERMEIPIPSLADQRRFVDILVQSDALRALRAKADSRITELPFSLFAKMFGSAGPPNELWPIRPLATLGDVVTGNTPPRADSRNYGNFVEWVKTDDIDDVHGVIRRASESLSEHGARRGRIVPAGSVIITCIAGSLDRLGDAAISDREIAINQQINAVIPRVDVSSEFLWQLVRSSKEAIQNRATGVMTKLVNKSTLQNLPVICPSAEVQRVFCDRITAIRSVATSQHDSRQKLDEAFRSLCHSAFQGKP
jgi:type I restriction enzyme S subunit